MPRKTDSNNPADWLAIAETELECVRLLVNQRMGHDMCQSKLAEILEKVLKAELLRRGWFLEKTHDLERLRKELFTRDAALAISLEAVWADLAEVYFTAAIPASTWKTRTGRCFLLNSIRLPKPCAPSKAGWRGRRSRNSRNQASCT